MEINPYQLDWGHVFVDSYNVETKNATLIYNFNFHISSLYPDYVLYSAGHIRWAMLNLPPGSSITAIFDVRGITLSHRSFDEISQQIENHLRNFIDEKLLNISFKF